MDRVLSAGSGNPEAALERAGVQYSASVQQDAALNLDIIFLAPAAAAGPGRRRQRHGSGSPLLRSGSQPGRTSSCSSSSLGPVPVLWRSTLSASVATPRSLSGYP